jgi:cyanophycin synthetase
VLKRVIVQNVAVGGMAVLNAADPTVAAMAERTRGDVTFFAQDVGNPVMAMHRAQGRRVVFVEEGYLVAAQESFVERIDLKEVPITRGGVVGFQVENVMASVAAAWGVGTSWDAIRLGLKTFVGESDNAPGRFNVFDYKGATVIADYGHNPDAIAALVNAVESMPAKRRSVVISGAGDRRDQDITQQTEILGAAFDDVLLYQDQCQRGRADGEVIALLRAGLSNATRTGHVEEINGEFVAIDRALSRLEDGDLCLILIDQVDEALAHITARVKAAS